MNTGHYIVSVYTIIAIAIVSLLAPRISNYARPSVVSFLVGLVCIIGFGFSDRISNYTARIAYTHALWLTFIVCISISMSRLYISNKSTFYDSLWATVILTILMVLNYKNINTDGMGAYLFWSLFALLISRIVFIVRGYDQGLLSYVGIVLFSLYMVYDMRRIQTSFVDKASEYPRQSLNIFLDFINLWINLSR